MCVCCVKWGGAGLMHVLVLLLVVYTFLSGWAVSWPKQVGLEIPFASVYMHF